MDDSCLSINGICINHICICMDDSCLSINDICICKNYICMNDSCIYITIYGNAIIDAKMHGSPSNVVLKMNEICDNDDEQQGFK